jgi:hypothetical protein
MSQRTVRAVADKTATRRAPSSLAVEPFDGMLDERTLPDADGPYGPREPGRSSSAYHPRGIPGALHPAAGAPRRLDALDRMIELAGMLDPEDWLGRLTAQARS